MTMHAGVWIDQAKAVVIALDGQKEKTVIVESQVAKQFRSPEGRNDGSPNGRRLKLADDIRERSATEHLNKYYDRVIALLKTAESIFIFGPGETKSALAKRLKKNKVSGRLAGTEAADKMTAKQISAKVRDYFHAEDRRNKENAVTSRKLPDFHKSRRKTDIV